MAKRFPITEEQFWDWLRTDPRKMAATYCRCPISQAILELTGQEVTLRYAALGGPKWARDLAVRIDKLAVISGIETANLFRSGWRQPKGVFLKLLAPTLLLFFLAVPAAAQFPGVDPQNRPATTPTTSAPLPAPQIKPVAQQYRFRFDVGVIALIGGGTADTMSSLGRREAGIFRDKTGQFAAGPNIAFKIGLGTTTEILKWRYPEHRRTIVIFQICIGAFWGGLAVHNARVGR